MALVNKLQSQYARAYNIIKVKRICELNYKEMNRVNDA